VLLPGPFHGLLASIAFRAAEELADAVPLPPSPTRAWVETTIDRLAGMLGTAAAHVAPERRDRALAEARALLAARLARRLPLQQRLALARYAALQTPDHAGRRHRVAEVLAARAGLAGGSHLLAPDVRRPDALLAEAQREARAAIEREPRLLAAPALLDRLLRQRGAPDRERRPIAERVLRELPFDRWARARMAVFELRAGRDADAYDHLRYTWMLTAGMAGDRELAVTLDNRFWRLGLPEKGGLFSYLLTGRVPEAPERATVAR